MNYLKSRNIVLTTKSHARQTSLNNNPPIQLHSGMPLLNAYVGVAVLFAVIIYGFEVCMMIREWYYLRNIGFPIMFADFLTVTEFEAQRAQKQLLMESEV